MTSLTKSLALAAGLALAGGASAYAGGASVYGSGGCSYGHSKTASNPEVVQQSVKTADAVEQQSSKPATTDAKVDASKAQTTGLEIATAEKTTE